ncbi:MAG: excinuclease ABC subunit UvrC [Termitinemataceae bacterium]|nr:MAG: excinuclease ABC subunit UvrC [Termitinemataceae bacterium]
MDIAQNEKLQHTNALRPRAVAESAPTAPGCYIMRNKDGEIIYIGKAKILRNRLISYFRGLKDIKTTTLMHHVHSIETIIVQNEYEALLLENTLIKQHTPKYNISLKDGKTYPVIRITADKFPKVYRTRRIINDGSRYFGPYPQVHTVDALLNLADKIYPIRKCKIMHRRNAPCLYYHIGRCKAPCCGKIKPEEYAVYVNELSDVFSGDTESMVKKFTLKMHDAAILQKYELAAEYRDAIFAIGALQEQETVTGTDSADRDYIAFAAEGILCTFSVFEMRGGRLSGQELFRTRSAAEEGESLATFILSYYSGDRNVPPVIYVQALPSLQISPEFKRYFDEHFGFVPQFCSPDSKRHESALAMAYMNAKEDLIKRQKERGLGPAIAEMQKLLDLKHLPQRIEGFDIAQLDGKHPVSSLISFKNGIPDKRNYRYFKLKTVIGKVDDFAAMREAVFRRYSRLIKGGDDLPDLILIDGGIGQVNAAYAMLAELGLDIDVIGLAKRNEELWKPHSSAPIVLSRSCEALKILQAVRDETHRFATGLNQRLRSKDLSLQTLESIDGIGAKRAAKIIKEFGSIDAIAETPPQEIATRLNIQLKTAKIIMAACRLAKEDAAEEKSRLLGHL